MEWLFNWKVIMMICGVSAAVVISFLLIEDNIDRMPKCVQAWWKRHICDTYENLWPNG